MVRVKYTGNTPEYLDGFPEECKRSCKGAIHLLPGTVKELTAGEYQYVKKTYPKLRLVKFPDETPAVKKMTLKTEEPAKATEEKSKKKRSKSKTKLKTKSEDS